MGHYYTREGVPRFQIPKKSGEGMKDTTKPDAMALGLYPSVTEKLSGVLGAGFGLLNWEVDIHLNAGYLVDNDPEKIGKDEWKSEVKAIAKIVKDEAPDLGKRIHAAIETYFRWKLSKATLEIEPFPDDLKPYIRAVDKIATEHGLMPDDNYMEKIVVNHETKDAGTLDWRGKGFGKERVYVDWKSQKFKSGKCTHYEKWGLQVAHYAESDGGIEGASIVTVGIDTSGHPYTDSSPRIDIHHWENGQELETMFKKISDLYFFLNDWVIK